MKCACGEQAVYETYCQEHFIERFESKVEDTVKRFDMVKKGEKIVVAASGGKDSTAVLYLLKKFGYDIEALAIDEGIAGYRDSTLEDLKRFCQEHDIPLHIDSYKGAFGFTLDEGLEAKKMSACYACGVFRRYLLNKNAKGFDKVATGHNLDDESQSILMNMLKGNTAVLARLGPVTGQLKEEQFIPRIKPLYFCTEKEVATYAFLLKFGVQFTECPNAGTSIRNVAREAMSEYEKEHPGAKLRLVEAFVEHIPELRGIETPELQYCTECGSPSGGSLCRACKLSKEFLTALN